MSRVDPAAPAAGETGHGRNGPHAKGAGKRVTRSGGKAHQVFDLLDDLTCAFHRLNADRGEDDATLGTVDQVT